MTGAERAQAGVRTARDDANLRRVHRLLCSPLVDEATFRASLGSGRADLATILRYLRLPVAGRPALAPLFDPVFYRARNPDLPAAADPLLDFLGRGLPAWRDPHPLVDLLHMAAQQPGLFGATPDDAALAAALAEGRIEPSPYFDLDHYARQAPGPAAGRLRQFLDAGLAAGLLPNRWLDPAWYARAHDDVPGEAYAALRHFVVVGDPAGRPSGPLFDGALYRRRYADVQDAGVPPLHHFLAHGRREGRQAAADRRPPRAPGAAPAPLEPGAAIPVDAAMVLHDRAELARRLADLLHAERRARRLTPPPLVTCADPLADLARIALPAHARPRLSILVPAHEQAAHTVACLIALSDRAPDTACEVMLADDGSTEPAYAALAAVANLTVRRSAANRGFVHACNDAYPHCQGDYVLLLNNDAQPLPGAIDRLVAALDADPTIAAAGGRLVYPDGHLQEAGCWLRASGESGLVGLLADPDDPAFAYDRDVAYCSGAALLLRRAAVGETLFDPAYAPAYCEDADLCLRLRAAGHRVRYVAGAVIVHALAASGGGDERGRRRAVLRNQARLHARWHATLGAEDRVRPIAFYLPQFHPTPENDSWWGAGFTEWTNVARARPSYAGHYQPHLPADLGFYDLRLPATLRAQAALAARYGVEGFAVYHYDFGERRLLDAPMRTVLADPSIPFRHCLCWANENWTRAWDGGDREVLIEQRYDPATLARIVADVVVHARDPRSLRVDGRPLFLVYRPLSLPDPLAFTARLRAALVAAGFPGGHLVYVDSMESTGRAPPPAALGFDAAVAFPPHGGAVPASDAVDVTRPGWAGYRYDFRATVLAFATRAGVPWARYPAVFPGWDNTPRQPLRATSFDGATPEAFGFHVERAAEAVREMLVGEHRLLFVNAWNEWAEGAHLEPDHGFGHRWLEALRDGIAAAAWG